jgi:hypothetical protein
VQLVSRERPILKKHWQGEAAALAAHQATAHQAAGGDRLDELLAELHRYRFDLQLPRISSLAPWADSDPCSCDSWELEHLIERLAVVLANRGGGDAEWFG